jgi:hypothetical protein
MSGCLSPAALKTSMISPLRAVALCALVDERAADSDLANQQEIVVRRNSFGGGLHEGFFFLAQAVGRIHQLVYLPLQRARVRLGIALLRRRERSVLASKFSRVKTGDCL